MSALSVKLLILKILLYFLRASQVDRKLGRFLLLVRFDCFGENLSVYNQKSFNDISIYLEGVCESEGEPPGRVAGVADEGEALEWVVSGAALASHFGLVLYYDHGEHPGVD